MLFQEELLGYIIVSITDAIGYCKAHMIYHTDITPQNILVHHKGSIKLCDFGESKLLDKSPTSTFVGIVAYWPPERFDIFGAESHDEHKRNGIRADIWSFGISLLEIILGKLPFFDQNEVEGSREEWNAFKIYSKLSNTCFEDIIHAQQSKYSDNLLEFILLCLRKVDSRPQIEALKNCLVYQQYKSRTEIQIAKQLDKHGISQLLVNS
uniref:mitogen-activated protein kinase kinase n=1 Tax=Acrobeloides nanus TaxID=290746 RepID=A0A914BUF4_9BILA